MSGTWGMIGGTLVGQGGATDPLTVVQHSSTVTVTAHATAHTKGAWVEIIASTSGEATMLVLDVSGVGTPTTATATLIDLATGAGGSEVAFLSNLPVGSAGGGQGATIACFQVPLPISVPAGTRISARIQSVVTGGKTATVGVAAFSGGAHVPGSSLAVLGASTGTSLGTSLDTAYTQIVASTAATYTYLIPVPSASSTSLSTQSDAMTLGVGAAASEVDRGAIMVQTNTSEGCGTPVGSAAWPLYAILPGAPAGSRLALKRGAGLGTLDGAIIGVA